MSDYRTKLEIGDRVAQDNPGESWESDTVRARRPPRLGTVRAVPTRPGETFVIEWDNEPDSVCRGWLRHALRKIPRVSR